MFPDITVVDSDLSNVFPNVNNYKFEGQADFSEQIDWAKRRLYRDIQDREGFTDTEMDDVRDLVTEELKDAIVTLALYRVFMVNGDVELAKIYLNDYKATSLKYHYDSDSDNTLDDNEERTHNHTIFSR